MWWHMRRRGGLEWLALLVVGVTVAAGVMLPGRAWAQPGLAVQGVGLAGAPALRLPAGAVVGSTKERRAAWEGLSAEAQQQTLKEFEKQLAPKIEQALAGRDMAKQPELPAMAGILDGKTGQFPTLGGQG